VANIDAVFEKSNLEESQKQAKRMFGKMLIYLRKNNHIKLYAMLESVNDMNIVDNVLKLTLSDRTAYDMITNKEDLNHLCNAASSVISDTKVELYCNGAKVFDMHQFESKLQNEFGKILTIVRK